MTPNIWGLWDIRFLPRVEATKPAASEDKVFMSAADDPSRSLPHHGSTRKPRKSRGRGLRATTGCKVCRKRHMKCDEVKPICGPCGKSSRPCEYEDAPGYTTLLNDHGGVSPSHGQPTARPSLSGVEQEQPQQSTLTKPPRNSGTPLIHGANSSTRWFGLLPTDTADVDLNVSHGNQPSRGSTSPRGRHVMQVSTIAPSEADHDLHERALWQSQEKLQLQGLEYDMYNYFVQSVSAWFDTFDPMRHFAILIPRLALYNEGLLKAMFALSARHLAVRAARTMCDTVVFQHAAVQYYAETLSYLQSAMRHPSYKNSQEVLATTFIVSSLEMIDGRGKGWDRHLKGVFWIQRTREIDGESGGLEQAVWWGWLHQDLWAAFRARRRCLSIFKPTKSYSQMSMWDLAARIVYILSECVNFASDEEKRDAGQDTLGRLKRYEALLELLEEWKLKKGASFDPLPLQDTSSGVFQPRWIHPAAFALCVQMYHVGRIILLRNHPNAATVCPHDLEREQGVSESVGVVAGIASQTQDLRAYAMQYLFMAGLFCNNATEREAILHIIEEQESPTERPLCVDFTAELKAAWSKD